MVYLAIFSLDTWKEYIFCYRWVECSLNGSRILLVDIAVESYSLNNLFSRYSTIIEQGMLKYLRITVDLFICLSNSIIFASYILLLCCFGGINIENVLCHLSGLTLSLYNVLSLFISDNFYCSGLLYLILI